MSNIIYPENERLSELVTGMHQVPQGTPKGVFTTVDDRFLLIDVNQYDKLANDGVLDLTTELSYEDAKMLYGAKIIKEYLDKQEQARQQAVERKRQAALDKATRLHSERGEKRKIQVLEKVLLGYPVKNIAEVLECSDVTVYNAINSFTGDYVIKTFRTYLDRKTLIEERDVFKFIDLNCNYKEYYKYMADKKEKAVRRTAHDKQSEVLQALHGVSAEPEVSEPVADENGLYELKDLMPGYKEFEYNDIKPVVKVVEEEEAVEAPILRESLNDRVERLVEEGHQKKVAETGAKRVAVRKEVKSVNLDDVEVLSEADMSARIDALMGNIPEKAVNGVAIEEDELEVFKADGEWGE